MESLQVRAETVRALFDAQTELGRKNHRLDMSATYGPPNDESDGLRVDIACSAVGERFWLLVTDLASRETAGVREQRLEILVPSSERGQSSLSGEECVELSSPVKCAVQQEYDLDRNHDAFVIAVHSLADDVSGWVRRLPDRDRERIGVRMFKDRPTLVVRQTLDELLGSPRLKIRPLSELGERTYSRGELPNF